jgi:hypothetical protein
MNKYIVIYCYESFEDGEILDVIDFVMADSQKEAVDIIYQVESSEDGQALNVIAKRWTPEFQKELLQFAENPLVLDPLNESGYTRTKNRETEQPKKEWVH